MKAVGSMKIGLFLGYGPDTVLGKEGLGRYLGNLIKSLQATGNQVTVACPKWLCDTLEELFKDFSIDKEEVGLIVTSKIPVICRLFRWKARRQRRKRTKIFKKGIQWGAHFWVDVITSITNIFLFGLFLLAAFFLAIILIPMIAIAGLAGCLFLLICKVAGKYNSRIKFVFEQLMKVYEVICYDGMRTFAVIYYQLIENSQKQLVKKINESKKLDLWYSPAIFWPAFNEIKAKKVINVPDLVTIEFAEKWGGRKDILHSSKHCEKTISNGNYFIVYGNYVKESVLIHKFNKAEKNVAVIPHGVNDMKPYITIDSQVVCNMGMQETFTKSYCKNLLQTLAPHSREMTEYIREYRFDDVKYIFYPSQLRPHKNILNLVKAYEYLLRKKYVRIKLFFTCNPDDDAEVKEYVFGHRLQYDILFFHQISVQQLAALYKRAELVVNPTLYEGGFPFTFGEGMSVGTPSVMSRIPQVLEMTDDCGWEDYLFDPYDYKDIASKIMYGLEHRMELVSAQKQLFDNMKKRTWEVVGKEYVEVFKYFVEQKDEEEML